MKRYKLVIAFVLVFVLGALTSAVVLKYAEHGRAGLFSGAGRPDRTEFIVKRLTRRLDLSPDQQASVKEIVNEAQKEIVFLSGRFAPELERIMDESAEQIKDKLDPAQREKADQMFEHMKNHMKRRMMHEPGAGHGEGMMGGPGRGMMGGEGPGMMREGGGERRGGPR